MKLLTSILLIILCTQELMAQTPPGAKISGLILEFGTNHPLPSATIICLLAKDSTKKTMTFSDKNGLFTFDSLAPDKYTLYITFIGYESLFYPFTISKEKINNNLGKIEIKRIGLTLTEIEIVQTKNPIRIAKDTIEFNASSFKTKANAAVEDLLKTIPGIQIDNDGTIRVNGKAIQTIMVDGHELFSGGNYNLISRNLQADLIDKIQLIDRQGGEKLPKGAINSSPDNIINITIKKSMHNLISGEITAMYGTSERFADKINLSRFNNHQQILLLGGANNVNGAIENNSLGANGMQRSYNGGLSYHDEINKKTSIGINYITTNTHSTQVRSSLRNTIVNDSNLYSTQLANNIGDNFSNDFAIQMDYKIDSSQNINISSQLSSNQTTNTLTNTFESTSGKSQKINNGTRNSTERDQSIGISGSIKYDKMFKKKNRSLSVMMAYGMGNGKENEFNISHNTFFSSPPETISDTINQQTKKTDNGDRFFLTVTYTEPVVKNGFLMVSFTEDRANSSPNIRVSDFNLHSGKYDIINDSLSNIFRNITTQHFMKLAWRYEKEKFSYAIAVASLLVGIRNRDIELKKDFVSRSNCLLPEINFNYLIENNKRLQMSYIKNQDFPQISQLLTIKDNTDPLHIKIGNPFLKPMSIHNFGLSYNSFNNKSFRSFNIGINGRLFSNQIVNNSSYDSIGREIVQPVNTNGSYIFDINLNNTFPLQKRPNTITLNTKASISRYVNYANGTKILHNDLTFGQSAGFRFELKDFIKYAISGNINYSNMRYVTQQTNNFQSLNGGISVVGDITLPYGIIISTNTNFTWTTGRMEGYNSSPIMLHASISKNLFSNQQGVIKIQGFDLLKQNTNIIRIAQDNYVEDTRFNSLERFFLIGFSYYLGKKKK